MKKLLYLIVIVFSLAVIGWAIINPAERLGATILTTYTTSTIGEFRTNVNTSLTNLNTDKVEIGGDIGGSTSTPTVTDLTITSEATGTIVQFNGANWVVLTPGTSGKFLQSNGAGSLLSYESVTASPGGSNTEIQYSNAGTLAGDSNLTWASGTATFTVGGTINVTALNASTTVSDTITINSFTVSPLLIGGSATSTISGSNSMSTIGGPFTVTGTSTFTGEVTLTAGLGAGNLDAASVDGDDINSNIAGRSLTLTSASPDTLDADTELYTDSTGFGAANATSTNNGARQKTFFLAATITEITCSTNGANITIGVDERAPTTPDSAGTDVFNGGSMVCDSNGNSTTTFANAGITAGNILNVDVDATANSTTTLRFAVKSTNDD